MIENNSPKFEALYGCEPVTLIVSPLVVAALFGDGEVPPEIHCMHVVVGLTPTVIPQLAIHKGNAALRRDLR
jgi:hypothetical protein